MLYNMFVNNKVVFMKKNDKETLEIVIGGNFDKDFDNLIKGKLNLSKHPKNVIYLDSFEQLNKILSPKKLDLFNYLTETQDEKNTESLTKISQKLQRKQEAISRDIKQLNMLGLIVLKKVKQTIYAIPKYKRIKIITKN